MELRQCNSILADCLMICDMSVRYWRRVRLVNCTAQCSVSNGTSKSADCGSTSSPPYSHGKLRYHWCCPSVINMSYKCRAAPRHAAPRRATPRHAAPRHATPRHATPRHATPRHATQHYCICLLLHCGALTARWCGVSWMIVSISHIFIFVLIHTKLDS